MIRINSAINSYNQMVLKNNQTNIKIESIKKPEKINNIKNNNSKILIREKGFGFDKYV